MSLFRKVLLLVLLLGWSTSLSQLGTFASFTASTADGATFATGTLVLSDTVDSGSKLAFSTSVSRIPPTSRATSARLAECLNCARAFTRGQRNFPPAHSR